MNVPVRVLYVAAEEPDDWVAVALDTGAETIRAVTAVDALKRLEDEAVDCIVSRATLPDMALDDFLDVVREIDPILPVVVVGEADQPTAINRAIADEATDYIAIGDDDEAVVGRVRRAVVRQRTDEALERHDRLHRLQREITRDVVDAATRDDIEQQIYDRLTAGGLYQFAWIGEYDVAANEMLLHVPFDGRFDPTELESLVDGGEPTFVVDAIESGDVAVSRGSVRTRGAAADAPSGPPTPGADVGERADEELATAAVPLTHDGEAYGILVLSTDRSHAFDEAERALLGEIADVIGHGLWALDENEPGSADGRGDMAEFAGLLAHELRNPLGIASTYLEIARETDDPNALDRIEEALCAAEETIESVLSVVGREGVEGGIVRDIADDAREAWGAVDAADAELVVDGSMPIEADHELVARLFANLFRNAIAHGGGDVTVRVGTHPDGFYVEDDGPGIPPEERDAVFEWGYSTTDDGVGIGLSVVREIVDAHGWTIAVTESDAGGARFEITGVDS